MNQQYQKPPKWFLIGAAVVGLILIIILIGTIKKAANSGTNSSSSSSKDSFGNTQYNAMTVAERIVKSELKSPSTAKFCSTREATITRSGNTWTVKGWVDAQNSFGATIRSNFTVTFTYTGRDSYTVGSCVIR